MIIDKTYLDGVFDATEKLTHEEAIACGFKDPYSAVISDSPFQKLLELRRNRLTRKKFEEGLIK
jgi:hypothetical protein